MVLVVVDDVRWDVVSRPDVFTTVMPTFAGLVADRGTVFPEAGTVLSLCCPARASIQTGTWAHTTGVYTNGPRVGQPTDRTTGGWSKFRQVADDTLATWLDDAGYRTGLVGKSFNGATTEVPPGWDRYVTFVSTVESNEGGAYYDYDLADQGRIRHHGTAPSDYSTDVLATEGASFLSGTRADEPVFLYWAPFASHGSEGFGTAPAPRHADRFSTLTFGPQPLNRGEADVSDKPAYIRREPIGRTTDASWQNLMRTHVRPLAAVDEGIARLLDVQRARGRADRTLVVLVGDNGYARGEHRWGGKETPYEETVQVPFVVVPPVELSARVARSTHLVTTADVAPTIAEYAGVPVPAFVEGRSVAPLVAGQQVPWRTDHLVEHLSRGALDVPTFCAVRSARWTYVVHGTGERELCDNVADPFQLQNLAGRSSHAAVQAERHARLRVLCAPRPPGLPPL